MNRYREFIINIITKNIKKSTKKIKLINIKKKIQ